MSTIYKYNNYILKPLTMLHLEVNTVGLVKTVFSKEKKNAESRRHFQQKCPECRI